jgi:hypothetical protein
MENSALVIIELYKIRTGTLMRDARAWFVSEFAPQSGKDIVLLMLSGEKQSSYYRMVASYWESAASLVNNGGIDEQMFLDANTEHLVVFAKLQPYIPEVREMIGEPDYLSQLERLVMKVPNLEKKLENRRTLLERWHQSGAAADRQAATG